MKKHSYTELRNLFSAFYENIKAAHYSTTNTDHRGHGLDHDITVAAMAIKIAPDADSCKKAWCAALLHSFDRIFEARDVKNQMRIHASKLTGVFNDEEINEIVEAAYRHNEMNQSDQSLTQITLMDADRLANMQSAVIIRGGQFRPTLPVLDFNYLDGKTNPNSTYESPKSILDNLRLIIINYVPQLRLPEAKRLGDKYSKTLASYIRSVEENYAELGLRGFSI
jgi:hypothetical protein